jgi:hypothetical protein
MKFRFSIQKFNGRRFLEKVVIITAPDMASAREQFYRENPGWDVSMLWPMQDNNQWEVNFV